MEPQKLCGNDVWVLQALGGGAGETWSLAKVIAHADALNHAILSYAELCRAVARLRALDLIVVDGDPSRDVTLFDDDGSRVAAIVKAGAFYRNRLAA